MNDVQTAISKILHTRRQKQMEAKEKKSKQQACDLDLEVLKEHMERTGKKCMTLAKGVYAVVEEQKTQPKFDSEVASVLLMQFLQNHQLSTPPGMKEGFKKFIDDRMEQMTEIGETKITITKKRPTEFYLQKINGV